MIAQPVGRLFAVLCLARRGVCPVLLLAADVAQAAGATPPLVVPGWFWLAFCGGAALLLGLDMFVFHRESHEPSLRESAMWALFWCGLGLAFNGLVLWVGG